MIFRFPRILACALLPLTGLEVPAFGQSEREETTRLAPELATEHSFEAGAGAIDPLQEGFQRLHDRDPAGAIEAFDRALQASPQHVLGLYGKAAALGKLQRHQEALEIINLVVERNPDDYDALSLRGVTHYNLGQFDRAEADFQAAVESDPKEAFYFEALAWALLCQGRADEAGKAALRANLLYKQFSGDPAFSLILAYLGFRMDNNLAEARKILRFASEQLDPISWPFPVIAFFNGNIDENGLIVEVSTHEQETEARTYIALQLIWDNRPQQARPHLEWVQRRGTPEVFEYALAELALGRLNNQANALTSIPAPGL